MPESEEGRGAGAHGPTPDAKFGRLRVLVGPLLFIEPGLGRQILLGVLVALLPFLLYISTICPTIYPGDGAEFVAAASVLGVPHPTGYPLFMLLGWVAQGVSPLPAALTMNLMTAFFGALACLGALLLCREIWIHAVGAERARRLPFLAASAAVGLLCGCSSTWWDQSNQTEVYSLLLLFLTVGWTLGLRLIRLRDGATLRLLAVWSGLAFLHHLLYMLAFAPALVGVVLFWRNRRPLKPLWGALGIMIVLVAVGYSYLPLRARTEPAINWGNPCDLSGVVRHVSGGQYKTTFVLTEQGPEGARSITATEFPGFAARRLKSLLDWMGGQVLAPLVPNDVRLPVLGLMALALAAVGLVALFQQSAATSLALALALLHGLVIVTIYTISDIHAYQLPLWLLAAALLPLGVAMGRNIFTSPERTRADDSTGAIEFRALVVAGILLALAAISLTGWRDPERGVNKTASTQARDYALGVMEALPQNAAILTRHDYDIYPLWHAQIVEGARPDVAVIGANFILNGWYAPMLRRTLPEGAAVFVGDEPPGGSDRWLVAVMGGVMAPLLESGRRVFVTSLYPELDFFARYYELTPFASFVMPAPTVYQFKNPSDESEADIASSPPRIVLYEVRDPRNFRATARERLHEMFGAQAARLVSRSPTEPKP